MSFVCLGVIVIVATFLFQPRQYDRFVKWLCRAFLRLIFIKVSTKGLEKIDPDKTYLFMSNHVNIFDVFLLYGYIPNFARGVELDDHFRWPIWGQVITRFGNIPISQKYYQSALESLSKAETALKNGTSIIILPEGHRTKDGKLLPFMRGPFLLAQRARVDIVPMAMIGAFEIKRVNHWLIRPGTVKLVVGDVISPITFENLSTKELRDRVKANIQSLIDNN
ncbi:MAG: 1-acyl-sn-glycerol-3-phosphate acyltransferase [candidate division KSB1 bacterium]|nr:1-acyl-sn-glycerol-3-phosphate acyltransferase [candidate division KSB1 bacterium]